MRLRFLVLASAIAGMLAPVSAVAHHSGAQFDRTKSITFRAVVVEFRYASPHPELVVDEKDGSGKVVRWAIQVGPNPTELTRNGWGKKRSETVLTPGSVITLTVAPSKVSPVHGLAQKIIAPDGELVFGMAVLQPD